MSDARVYAPINQCDLVGYEKAIHSVSLIQWDNVQFCFNDLGYRFFIPNIVGMIVDNTGTIQHIYTNPDYRRQGYAKQLVALVRHLGIKVKHSDNLTNDGKLFVESIEK